MKWIVLIVTLSLVAGCGKTYRTGTICVEPFVTAKFRTTNPVDVKQDVVDAIRDQLQLTIENKLNEESKLAVIADCARADYTLSGKIIKLDTAMQGSIGKSFFGGIQSYSQRSFGVGYACTVKDNKSNEIIMTRDDYMHRRNLESNLDSIGGDLAEDLRYSKK